MCLARQAGETVPKDELLKAVWPDTFVTDDGLVLSISELRRVFQADAREARVIRTIPKRGYRLVAPVEPVYGLPAGVTPAAQSSATGTHPTGDDRRRKVRVLFLPGVALLLVGLIAGSGKIRRWLSSGSNDPPIHSIAVLPLQNLSGDATQEYFSDGMTDALITDLAQIGPLKVISRTSSMQYRQTKKSLPEIARELNVDGIVEGTVQYSGDRVRITAQFIHGRSDKHLWANSYERDLRDIFTLEREVTGDIAHQIRAQIATENQVRVPQPRPVNLEALEVYLQGNSHLTKADMGPRDEELRKATDYFQHAIDADPAFAPACIGLAEAHHNLWWPSSEDFAIMRTSAEKALELAPTSADAREPWDSPNARTGTGRERRKNTDVPSRSIRTAPRPMRPSAMVSTQWKKWTRGGRRMSSPRNSTQTRIICEVPCIGEVNTTVRLNCSVG